MKITKRQLRRIIREEKARLVKEQATYSKDARDWMDDIGQLVDQDLMSRGVWYEHEGGAIIEALEMLRRYIKDEMTGPSR